MLVNIAAAIFIELVALYAGAWILYGSLVLVGAVLNPEQSPAPQPSEPFSWRLFALFWVVVLGAVWTLHFAHLL